MKNVITPTLTIIGSSPAILRAIERMKEVAPTDLSVLITGESGTGKEVFAQAIHALSKRRARRMVSINCGAIPEQLLESELFGSEKGAFTGATEQRRGFFEAAHQSSIFLDELGEMPVGTQVKFLRVLETGEFSRLGSPETLTTDVRVIAATNRHLEDDVVRGRFRKDLYYRLNTVQIELPALREHVEDIPELVEFFALRTATKIGVRYEGISQEALGILQQLPWAGNIRELRNMVETVVTLAKGRFITPEALVPYLPKALKQHLADDTSLGMVIEPLEEHQMVYSLPLPASAFPASPLALPPPAQMINTDSAFVQGARSSPMPVVAAPPSSLRLPNKTPEQIERELMYKALLDLVREVATLRNELTEMKQMLYAPSSLHSSAIVPQNIPHEMVEMAGDAALNDAAKQSLGQEALGTMTMQELERRLIAAALQRFEGNRKQAAEALGISERTLYRKLHEYGFVQKNSTS